MNLSAVEIIRAGRIVRLPGRYHGPRAIRWLPRCLLPWLCAVLWPGQPTLAQGPQPPAGLVRAENWELVLAHCSGCHSLGIVTGQRGSRERWLAMIRWMQETQNLWAFEPATEEKLLDYLAANYGMPERPARRLPLPAHLLPARQDDHEPRPNP